VARGRFPKLRNKSIVLLIAHPDDEAMFFAPTLLALTDPSLGNHLKILCLSSGDADGLGAIRKKELVKSGLLLGLRSEEDVFVIESPDFPDSMTTNWATDKISSLLTTTFTRASGSTKSAVRKPTIDVLITFDARGISSHPNHKSLYHGARAFASSLASKASKAPVALYSLTSINIVRKYSSFMDVVASIFAMAFGRSGRMREGRLVFMSGLGEMRRAQRAMTDAHVSQMRWFRWGWIVLSRYMVVNDLKLEKL